MILNLIIIIFHIKSVDKDNGQRQEVAGADRGDLWLAGQVTQQGAFLPTSPRCSLRVCILSGLCVVYTIVGVDVSNVFCALFHLHRLTFVSMLARFA